MSAPLQPFEFYDDSYGRHRPGEGMWEAKILLAPQRWILSDFSWPEHDPPCGYTLTPEGYSESLGLPMQFHGH